MLGIVGVAVIVGAIVWAAIESIRVRRNVSGELAEERIPVLFSSRSHAWVCPGCLRVNLEDGKRCMNCGGWRD